MNYLKLICSFCHIPLNLTVENREIIYRCYTKKCKKIAHIAYNISNFENISYCIYVDDYIISGSTYTLDSKYFASNKTIIQNNTYHIPEIRILIDNIPLAYDDLELPNSIENIKNKIKILTFYN